MANPLPHEDKLYQTLSKANIKVHSIIWELLNHHIRNDLHVIVGIIEDLFEMNEPLSEEKKDKVLERVLNISSLIAKLQDITSNNKCYHNTLIK